jgi:hypothetical protein
LLVTFFTIASGHWSYVSCPPPPPQDPQ